MYEAGILSAEDYEKKKKEVEEKYRQQDIEYMTLDEMIDYLKEQKSLVDDGSLSKDDFEKMRTDLKPLKKLRGMVDNGIITQEEYEVKKKRLYHGDIVFIHGLKIVPIGKRLVIYNLVSTNAVKLDGSFEQVTTNAVVNPEALNAETERTLYDENEYFYKIPRFVKQIKNMNNK